MRGTSINLLRSDSNLQSQDAKSIIDKVQSFISNCDKGEHTISLCRKISRNCNKLQSYTDNSESIKILRELQSYYNREARQLKQNDIADDLINSAYKDEWFVD
jgi:hypothetical protein